MDRPPRILVCTPEITYLPEGMGNMANRLTAKAGGLADVSASLVAALYDGKADVHVALPHYRRMFGVNVGGFIEQELVLYRQKLPDDRIHLAEDRAFYYRDNVYSSYQASNTKLALAFQRELANNIIPRVRPDLIHCNDWMTGLIPAIARRMGIPCLFTIHNIHSYPVTLEDIEDVGIDAAEFWHNLFFKRQPQNYEETRSDNPVDLLASGVFASHFINTVSPTFLAEIVDGHHKFVPDPVRREIAEKQAAGVAVGILNAPDDTHRPSTDRYLKTHYDSSSFVEGKRENKLSLQRRLGLAEDPDAPLFFWPSRLDPVQKGCQLLAGILFDTVSRYWDDNLQIAIIANGAYQQHFHDIVAEHDLHGRVAVVDFQESASRRGYAASDFMIMPSRFEPCGLPQMISAVYGSMPIVHDTGGLHDTVQHLDWEGHTGNGFRFESYDPSGLAWAIDEAMAFYSQPAAFRHRHIKRIMEESAATFNHHVCAQGYFNIYEEMLKRPVMPMN
jgi:ADP-glucose type glycogen/starch synthase